MTKTLSDMSVTEAASKALEVLVSGSFLQSQVKYPDSYTGSWEDYVKAEYDLEDDEDFSVLDDSIDVWTHVKYEISGEYTVDNLTAKVVAEYGGEGQGDQYWVVISISDGTTTRYFRKDGYYASYDGGTLDGETYEVTPVEKLVTFYE